MIGIGGTGAKCVEALTHLCAAGMLPEQNMYCLFVDPDRANGSLARATVTLRQYQACHNIPMGNREAIKIFRTKITTADPHVWSPFLDKERPQLADFFEFSTLKTKHPRAAQLFDVLYSDAEKETSLEMGFRGHPSLGAAIMARTVNLGEAEPWLTFRKMISTDAEAGQEAKIFMFGSIFGGTGASGFPTIARLIKNGLRAHEVKFTKLGGALLLPYFTFIPSYKKEELRAAAESFLMNTQMALQYYHGQQKEHDTIYLLGESEPSPVRFSIGASEQKNEAHFIELYAALAAYDFFTRSDGHKGYAMVAREEKDKIDWLDIPDGKNSSIMKPLITQLTRLAFAYLDVYITTLKDIRKSGKSYRAPWYVDYFERNKHELDSTMLETQLSQMVEYCKSFLLWLAQIETSAKMRKVELINHNPFAEEKTTEDGSFAQLLDDLRDNEFSNLVYPLGVANPKVLSKVWENMSDMKVRDPNALGLGKFFHALYKSCE